MRLVIFIGCLVSLIFISRWFTIPAETERPAAESQIENIENAASLQPVVAKAVFVHAASTQPLANRFAEQPSQNGFEQTMPPTNRFGQQVRNTQPSRSSSFDSSSVANSAFQPTQTFVASHPSIAVQGNAKNVRTLVRAEYVLPKDAASILEKLFLLDPESLVETKIIESENEEMINFRVTTDAKAQQATGNFLSSLYPAEKIAILNRDVKGNSADQAAADVLEPGNESVDVQNRFGLGEILE